MLQYKTEYLQGVTNTLSTVIVFAEGDTYGRQELDTVV